MPEIPKYPCCASCLHGTLIKLARGVIKANDPSDTVCVETHMTPTPSCLLNTGGEQQQHSSGTIYYGMDYSS